MLNKFRSYNMISGLSATFQKGTGRWIVAFALILLLTFALDGNSEVNSLDSSTFFLLIITCAAIISNFWHYSGNPSLIKRLPQTYKEDVFYTIIGTIYTFLILLTIIFWFFVIEAGVNMILGQITIDTIIENIIDFLETSHYHILYSISLTLFLFGTFYPLSFTNGKRLFWITVSCFLGAMALYNSGMSLLLNDGIWNFDCFLSRFDQSPNGMWVSLLSLGISVFYAIGGTLVALKLHRPKRYDNI